MPLTPFHLGPALLLVALLYRRIDLPTIVVASVIIDVRAALVLFGPLDGPVHGIPTSLFGATVVGVLLAAVSWRYRPRVDRWIPVRVRQRWTRTSVAAGALAGTYSHVLLDAILYAEAPLLFPFPGNPFAGTVPAGTVYATTAAAGVVALPVLWWRVRRAG